MVAYQQYTYVTFHLYKIIDPRTPTISPVVPLARPGANGGEAGGRIIKRRTSPCGLLPSSPSHLFNRASIHNGPRSRHWHLHICRELAVGRAIGRRGAWCPMRLAGTSRILFFNVKTLQVSRISSSKLSLFHVRHSLRVNSLKESTLHEALRLIMAPLKQLSANAVYPNSEPLFSAFPSRRSVVHSTGGMVASTQPLASEAGQRILKQGGNAAVRHLLLNHPTAG